MPSIIWALAGSDYICLRFAVVVCDDGGIFHSTPNAFVRPPPRYSWSGVIATRQDEPSGHVLPVSGYGWRGFPLNKARIRE